MDTNVLVSGIFFSGPPFQILNAWQQQKLQLVLSPEILAEYQRVAIILGEKYKRYRQLNFSNRDSLRIIVYVSETTRHDAKALLLRMR